MDEKPKGHGDWAEIIRRTWSDQELLQVRDEIVQLEQSPGYARVSALLAARDDQLIDRLLVQRPDNENIRATDQVLGTVAGLRQMQRAIDSIIHEANQARERAERRAAEADAERGAPA